MSRPLRLEFPGALFHVFARGNRKETIFRDDLDRKTFLNFLGESVNRFGWILTAYALMPNHFHLVVQLTIETLSRGMHWLNGRYSQAFNKRHGCVGHVFQGRFKSLLVEKESYALDIVRYVVLNPVKAHIVARPEDYLWSSHRAALGQAETPSWLAIDDLLIQFAPQRELATALYRQFVDEGIDSASNLWQQSVGGTYLGSEKWLKSIQEQIDLMPRSSEHPTSYRVVDDLSLSSIIATVAEAFGIDKVRLIYGREQDARMVAAWIGSRHALSTGAEIATALGLKSSSHASMLVRRCEGELRANAVLRARVDQCLSTIGRKSRITDLTPNSSS